MKKANTIKEALTILNEAAKSQKEDFKAAINEDTTHVKNILGLVKPEVEKKAAELKYSVEEKLAEAQNAFGQKATELKKEFFTQKNLAEKSLNELEKSTRQSIQKSPWKSLGVASAAFFVAGFLTRRK